MAQAAARMEVMKRTLFFLREVLAEMKVYWVCVCVCVCRENHAQDVVGREQICPLVLLNKICLIRGNSSISQGASQSFSFFFTKLY